ncbi:MAG: hypothetical protein B7Y99_11785 [Caulobacterales bacterium 32-69-10]|nr:MAG: hypothetical protein B7Y99_11785 [Caulobacterales bacterium 32-69-10]
MSRYLFAAGIAALAVAGCSGGALEAPVEPGVCFHMVQEKDGAYRFNELARNQPNLENCAARLEDMRLNFNRLGQNAQEVVGAFQGQYIFIQPAGVFSASSLTSNRYPALVRTPDGRLAIPGAMQQQPAPPSAAEPAAK